MAAMVRHISNSRVMVLLIFSLVFILSLFLLNTTSTSATAASSLEVEVKGSNQSVPFLIIVAEARSGSTWLESFFTQNERVLDFFEPLDQRAFAGVLNGQGVDGEEYDRIKLEILGNECQCQFKHVRYPSMGEYGSWSKSLHRLQGYLNEQGEVKSEFRKPKSTDLKAMYKLAKPQDLTKAEEMCRSRDLITSKVIRLTDLSLLTRLPSLGCTDFKILHLVRDPRPVIQSRMQTFGELRQGNGEKTSDFAEDDIRSAAAEICQSYLHNARVGLTPPLKDVYRIVKYEDLGSAPVEYVKEIYDFAGIEFTPDIESYIMKSSSGSTVAGKYEVIRNTAQVIENWKNTMDIKHVRLVESMCRDMLHTFNYRLYN